MRFAKPFIKATDLCWVDPDKAQIVGLKYYNGLLHSAQVKCEFFSRPRWMQRTRKGTGFSLRDTGGSQYNRGDVFFLPDREVWANRQQRLQEAVHAA